MTYYTKKYVQYLLLEGCRNRDFSALGEGSANIRALSVKCLFDLNRTFKLIGWEKHKQNLYVSCAKLKNIPQFTFNPKKRSSETRPWYRNEYNKEIYAYDLFFDFDKGEEDSWEDLIAEVKVLKEYLDEYYVPYFILFSGGKGIHVVIDGDYLEIKKISGGNIEPHKTIVENIKKMLNLKFVDLANNGVNSRLRKLPYSLVKENIALPFSDTQLDNFNNDDMSIENVTKKVKPLIRRGNLERYSSLSMEKKRRNVEDFINVFLFK
jgi:hypothetical protein